MAFIDQVVQRLGTEMCIDTARIYATGFSAGAAMAATLSCDRPDLLAAVAGSGGMNLSLPCPEGAPVDTLVIHGLEDPIAPPGGQDGVPPTGVSITSVADSYAARGGCSGSTTTAVTAAVELRRWTGCVEGGEAAALWIGGHGHNWAGRPDLWYAAAVTGPTSYDLDATSTVLDWFDHH